MSLSCEKYRSIFKMRQTLLALCFSKNCKIPDEWKEEIRAAIKHAPFTSDKITINGEKFKASDDYDSTDILVAFIDGLIDRNKEKRKKVKKK